MSGPTNLEKLYKLDKQLTIALSNSERHVHHREGVFETEHAFIDESPVDDFHERIAEPAKTYPFELDDFQKRAILHIEQQNFVFVAAHTSAGKTAIAEYAVALAALGGSKVFYTSPIKTLSNQKLRDFRTIFDDVGLVTGDVSINEDAQCVIMTTEILRSMLYRGADVIRDVSYVIFDEVQFLNDEERGVVWEESIIMLPPHIGIIMLSATVPNALEFASWVGKTKDRQVAVVCTDKRPVPLEHAILHPGALPGQLEASLLLEKGQFSVGNYERALQAINRGKPEKKRRSRTRRGRSKRQGDGPEGEKQNSVKSVAAGTEDPVNCDMSDEENDISVDKAASGSPMKKRMNEKGRNKNKGPEAQASRIVASGEGKGPGHGPNARRSAWTPLIRYLQDNERTPTVVFCFSKKGCERAVESLEGSDLLPNASDKAQVHLLFESAITRLREEDRNLPQIKRVFANLKRGISAHHAGLLPIVKEITEILFSEGLVKVLFATETFAMGINMPARTVVFSGVRKNDGRKFRALEAGEYTQMSGRAGRRGIDKVGHVYFFFPPGEGVVDARRMRFIMTGKPISLKSAFRLTYNMILNVLRVDELRVEEVMKRSFSEAGEDATQESIGKALSLAGNTLDQFDMESSSRLFRFGKKEALTDYVSQLAEMKQVNARLTFRELNPIFRDALIPGRLVIAEVETGRLCLAVVFSIVPRYKQNRRDGTSSTEENKATRDSQLWIAYLHSVLDQHAEKYLRSVLVLPESFDQSHLSRRTCKHPHVATDGGLVMALASIQAFKVMCIFDECYKHHDNQTLQQANSSKQFHFNGREHQVKKWLSKNASYVQNVLRKWGQEVDQQGSPFRDVISSKWTPTKRNSTRNPARNDAQPSAANQSDFERLSDVCREVVTSVSAFEGLASVSGRGLLSKIEELVVQQFIRTKLNALKTAQETGCQPRLLPDYEKRVEVLQELDYVGSDGLSVQLKGRCGCEVLTTESLVLTEIVCDNVLHGLGPAEVASLLSSLVCRKKNSSAIHERDSDKYSKAYCDAKAQMRAVVQRIGNLQKEKDVELDFEITDGCEDYESSMCRWDLAEAVREWASGEPFCRITELTEQQEGDIVVCVKRLSELLKDAQHVAKGVGNTELGGVLEEAICSIRRDVIFNGSLYYDEDF